MNYPAEYVSARMVSAQDVRCGYLGALFVPVAVPERGRRPCARLTCRRVVRGYKGSESGNNGQRQEDESGQYRPSSALDNASLTPEGRTAEAIPDLRLLFLENGKFIDCKDQSCFMNT